MSNRNIKDKPDGDEPQQQQSDRLIDIIDRDRQIFELLGSVQKTLAGAPALNGGFDRLISKVDKIENTQQQLVQKVDSVHDCLFEPDEGLYTRIRDMGQWQKNQEEKAVEFKKTVDDVRVLKTWKEQTEKEEKKEEKKEEELEAALKEVEQLKNWKENANKFLWLMGTSTLAIFIKGLWDLFSNHVALK